MCASWFRSLGREERDYGSIGVLPAGRMSGYRLLTGGSTYRARSLPPCTSHACGALMQGGPRQDVQLFRPGLPISPKCRPHRALLCNTAETPRALTLLQCAVLTRILLTCATPTRRTRDPWHAEDRQVCSPRPYAATSGGASERLTTASAMVGSIDFSPILCGAVTHTAPLTRFFRTKPHRRRSAARGGAARPLWVTGHQSSIAIRAARR